MQTSGEPRRENARVTSIVGWVERSDTIVTLSGTDGIASLHPSYGTVCAGTTAIVCPCPEEGG